MRQAYCFCLIEELCDNEYLNNVFNLLPSLRCCICPLAMTPYINIMRWVFQLSFNMKLILFDWQPLQNHFTLLQFALGVRNWYDVVILQRQGQIGAVSNFLIVSLHSCILKIAGLDTQRKTCLIPQIASPKYETITFIDTIHGI